MDFQSAMETFAEAWVAANTQTPLTEAAEAQQSLAVVQSSGVAPAPTGGGTAPSGGGGASGVGGQPGAPRASSTPPPTSTAAAAPPLATHGSPEDQDRSSSSCEAIAPPVRPPPPALAGKTLPVHCVVERVPSPQSDSQQPSVEVDSYAIVPSAALFADLVRTALTKLGYSPSEAICAKGVVQIKNWKPLSFDQITELPEATVADMLSDLVQVATLRIRLYSIPSNPNMWTVDSVKTAVIQLLKEMSQSKLAKICPLKQSLLSTIVNNKFNGKLGAEKCKEFGRWFMDYRQSTPATASAFLDEDKPPQDGRMTFHSSTELPRMREWYRQCPHPTNLQLQDFVNQLNCGPLRVRNKPKVALGTLKNWWKNERQRERRLKRHASGGGDEDSSPGSSASSGPASSKSTSCPIPVKLSAVTAAPRDRHEHSSPPTITDSPVLPHPQVPSQPSQPSQPPPPSPPQRSPLLRSPPLRSPPPPQPLPPPPPPPPSLPPPHDRSQHHPEHDGSSFVGAAAAAVPLRRIQYIHYPHFTHVNASTVPPPPASPGDVVMAFSSTPPS